MKPITDFLPDTTKPDAGLGNEDCAKDQGHSVAHDRLRVALEVSPCWVWESDADGYVTYVSENFYRLLGVPVEEYIGKHRSELICTEIAPDIAVANNALIARKEPFEDFTYPNIGSDDKVRWLRINGTPFYDELGNFSGYRGVGQDVSDEIQMEQSAQQAEHLLHSAIESLQDAFMLFDSEDRLVIANQAWRNLYGALSQQIQPGQTFEEIVRSTVDAGFIDHRPLSAENFIAERMRAHENPQGPIELKHRDGRWFRTVEQLIPNGGIAIVISDISDAARLERELRTAKEGAERANLAKSQFLASMSHELRTPLNATIGFSELILSEIFGPLGNQRYKNYIEDIKNSGTHLLEIINDLLDLSKIDARGFEPDPSPFAPDELVERCVRMLNDEATRKRLAVSLNLTKASMADGAPAFVCDRRAMSQIIINVVGNAIKFTGESGNISIISELDDSSNLTIIVKDNGIGIAAEDLPNIFDPFKRGKDPMVRERDGAGLGLSICHMLCQGLGGRLEIDSAVQVGTTVTIYLPTLAEASGPYAKSSPNA